MSESEQDRWRELADLLGLPPDEKGGAKGEERGASAEAPSSSHRDIEPEHAIRAPNMPQAEPAAAQADEPVFEEAIVADMNLEIEETSDPESALREPAADMAEEPADDRPRRGRRRGRRGSRNDRANRDDRAPDDAPDAAPAPRADGGLDEEPLERPDSDARVDRGGADDELGPGDDTAEPEDAETIEPAVDEGDEDEIDHLKDWNVPSWTELIGSLYRPER